MSSHSNQNIWEYNNDPKKTIICLIKRKSIRNPLSFNQFVLAVQDQTNCSIRVVGLEKEEEHFWISIQSDSKEARNQAYLTLNAIVNNECQIIELPQFDVKSKSNENIKNISSPEEDDDDDFLDENSFTKLPKRPLIRSTTTDFSATKKAQEESKPFGSVLSKFKMTSINDENTYAHLETTLNTLQVDENNKNQTVPLKKTNNIVKCKNIVNCSYSVEFLLSRAESDHSKKMPVNWKELNEKYPNVCFYGKVISYFNPHKYSAHWEKTKASNPILHNTPFSNSNVNNKRFISDKLKTNSFRSNSEFESLKAKSQTQHHNQLNSSSLTTRGYQNGKLKLNGDLTNIYQKQNQHHYNSDQRSDDKSIFSGKKNASDAPYLRKNYVQTTSKHFNSNNHIGRHENESILY